MVEQVDRAAEYLRVRDHYRGLADGELLALARQPFELTDVAQQALASELSSRSLKPEAEKPAAAQNPSHLSTSKTLAIPTMIMMKINAW